MKLLMTYKKLFLHYLHLRVSEGLDTETDFLQMNLGPFDNNIFKKCRYCGHIFDTKKN